MKKKGFALIVSAPSGAGKSTICSKVIETLKDIAVYSVSTTTRPPRKGEIDGKSYFFVTKDKFKKLVAKKKLLEWANVHGHYYGTPKEFIARQIGLGKVVVLDIDVQGAMKIKKLNLPNTVFVFIMTPTFRILKERLINRGSEDSRVIKMRLKNAKNELRRLKNYNYLVINDKMGDAVKKMVAIITAERLRIKSEN